jgi:hypothetical protein
MYSQELENEIDEVEKEGIRIARLADQVINTGDVGKFHEL